MGRGFKIFKTVLIILNLVAVSALLASYLAAIVNPEKVWFFAFAGIAYPLILAINALFIVTWLILWEKWIILSLIAILLGWNHLMSILPIRNSKDLIERSNQIKVLSYNVHRLYGKDFTVKNGGTRSEVTDFLVKQKADLLFLQEFYARGDDSKQILESFAGKVNLPHYTYRNYKGIELNKNINALTIFSKFPVVATGSFKPARGSVFGVFADILIAGDTVRLYNLHLESIRFGNEDYSFYSNLTENDIENEALPIKEGSLRMLSKLRKAFIKRASQVEILEQHIQECRYPVILAGDFNDTPFSFTYSRLTKTLKDAFRESGKGFFESTYAGKLPSFRIDYILYSSRFQSSAYQRHPVSYSDHYPIEATLKYSSK